MSAREQYRALAWAHGCLAVQRQAGMLGPVTFVLADGRQISPMQMPPWTFESEAAALPGVLRQLRGEWPCVPFGFSLPADGWPEAWRAVMPPGPAAEEAHGYSSNHPWQWLPGAAGSLRLGIDLPPQSPVARLERVVTPDPVAAAIDLELHIHVRAACRLPLGLHPTFRLPLAPGMARLEPGLFDHGLTYPATVEPGAALFASGQRFTDLAQVPARDGGVRDATALPYAENIEELLQLNHTGGTAALANLAEGYRVRLHWQREHFPSLLLWLSNRGRTAYPWNGRHLAVGIEPVCSPFGLGVATAGADNPIARGGTPTARAFAAGEHFVTRYRIAAEAL